MSRAQLSISVGDFDAAAAFCSRLAGPAPAKRRPGDASVAIADPPLKLALNCPGNGPGGTLNHLGVEVSAAGTRLDAAGPDAGPEPGAACCYAWQDEVWAHDPGGLAWEYYTVPEHTETP